MGKPASCWNCFYRIKDASTISGNAECGMDGHVFADTLARALSRDEDCPLDRKENEDE